MGENVLLEKKNGVGIILLNDPKSLNALSPNIRKGLVRTFREVKEDEEVKVVILAGKRRSFCAGGNVKNMNHDKQAYQTKEELDTANKICWEVR